jgi:hypothetical protein
VKRIALYLWGLLSCAGVFAQEYNPDLQLDSLIDKLHQVIAIQKDIETQEIKGVYKLTPWHFAPSLNYDFINDKYYFTISTQHFISHFLGKRQENRKLLSIERRYDNQIKSQEIRLKNIYIVLKQRLTNLQLSHEILLNDIEIFKIKSQQHDNNEIDTETFLKEKSSILNKIKNHNTDVNDIQRHLLEIELLTEFEIELDIVEFYVSPQVITLPVVEVRGSSNSTLREDKGGLQ